MFFPPSEYRRQTGSANVRPFLVWLVATVATLLFVSLVIVAPLAQANNYSRFALTIYQSFSTLCHQLPERSFYIEGYKFAVCARCTGLYAGFALTLLLYPLLRSLRTTEVPPRKWLFLAAFPLALDFSLGFFGIWQNTHSSRFFTGFLLASVAVFYVMPGVAELSLKRKSVESPHIGQFTLTTTEGMATGAIAPSDYSAPERRIR